MIKEIIREDENGNKEKMKKTYSPTWGELIRIKFDTNENATKYRRSNNNEGWTKGQFFYSEAYTASEIDNDCPVFGVIC